MTKEIVEQLRKEYLAIDERDWPPIVGVWFVSDEKDLDYVWLCASRDAAFARAKFWNADSEYRAETEGAPRHNYVVQCKHDDGRYEVITEEHPWYYL